MVRFTLALAALAAAASQALAGAPPGAGTDAASAAPAGSGPRQVLALRADDSNSLRGSRAAPRAAPYRPGDAVGLVGRDRDAFLRGAVASCERTAREDDAWRHMDSQIHDYCVCYSSRMADGITLDEVRIVGRDPSRIEELLGDRIAEAIDYCRANLGRDA
jgi:hypothetical protein